MQRVAWIRIVPEEKAEGDVRAAYDVAASARGNVAEILRVHSVHPQALLDHLHLYRELMFGESELTRVERETLAVAVSGINRCRY
jgi:alkylhydroperoxidase family enzyme